MKNHKGFSLVELVIVMAVIGILSSMFMLSSSESISNANANNIITNLRNFSMAAMAYYTDNIDTFGKTPNTAISLSDVTPYMHNEGNVPDKNNYIVTNDSGTWWAGYNLTTALDNDKVREKLQGRSESANLKGTTNSSTPPTKSSSDGKYPAYDSTHTCVWLLIRSPRN